MASGPKGLKRIASARPSPLGSLRGRNLRPDARPCDPGLPGCLTGGPPDIASNVIGKFTQLMSNPVPSSSNRRKTAWLGAAALAALIAGGAVESGFVPPAVPAYAQAPIAVSATQPMPSFADVVDKVKPAVVSVRVKLENAVSNEDGFQSFGRGNLDQFPPQLREFFKRFGENGMPQRRGAQQGLGSGFFISADGYVVTNNHVVDHAKTVQVMTDDGRTFDAKVVGTDPKTDVALLKVTESGGFPYVSLAKTAPRVGDWVVAIGNPFGLGGT